MAQKATKSLAARNTSTLNLTHLTTLLLHLLFHILRLTLLTRSLLPYILLSTPSLATELYIELLGRPTYSPSSGQPTKSGQDLGAQGLTEWMWDVVYWGWINLGLVVVFGDKGWWAWGVVPVYTGWKVVRTVGGVGGMLGDMGGAGGDGGGGSGSAGQSNRQKKMEKRGGQKVAYR